MIKELPCIDKKRLETHKYENTIVWDTYEIRLKINEIIKYLNKNKNKEHRRK